MTESYLRSYHYHKLYPYGRPYGYSFVSGWWVHSFHAIAHTSFSTLSMHSELRTFDFSGELTIALWRAGYPYYPEDEIARRTFYISAGQPDPKHFDTNFSGLSFTIGQDFWIRHWKGDFNKDEWRGTIVYYEL
ncbi:hypothetical protein ES703_102082 [subsurface metagenome]